MKTRRGRVLVVVAAVAVSALAYVIIDDAINHDKQIAWHELRQSNHERFLKQLTEALPTGTPKEDVDAYLARANIPYTYSPGISYSTYSLRARGVGRILWYFEGDLGADIELDADKRVRKIRDYAMFK